MDKNYVFEIEQSEEQRSKERLAAYAERIGRIPAVAEKEERESELK